MEKKSLPKYYYPQLDAIRGLSFLAVYFYHAFHPNFGHTLPGHFLQFLYANLDLSIDVFFILSSFLLTWLGISEFEKKGNFSFKNYFIRRALRIWPLYYILMLFSFVIIPLVASRLNVHVSLPQPYYYLLFISNFYTKDHVYLLKFLWTLSVEEQFYLVWGICLLLFQKYLRITVAVLLALSMGFTIYATIKNIPYYFHTLTYLFDFSLGAWAAIAIKRKSKLALQFQRFTKRKSWFFLALLPMGFIFFFFLTSVTNGIGNEAAKLCCRWAFIIYISFLLIEQMENKQTRLKLAGNNFLIYTGKISYGLYCFHGIVLTFGAILFTKWNWELPLLLQAVLLLMLNYGVSAVSYQFLEKPFLKLKNRLRRI